MEQVLLKHVKHYLTYGDQQDFNAILKYFQPLIRKYAKKLYYLEFEDSTQELSMAIYEALQKMTYLTTEFACISYFQKAVYHRFCKLYAHSAQEQKKLENQVPYEELITASFDSSISDRLFILELKEELHSMCEIKRTILILLLSGYTDKDIGRKLNCSRQYINRIKKSLLPEK
ncbi:RNA polymerase sigma factor [[Clostridium] polysaccharolyticum]|uniref:RNA polymerase sigma factor, sigma-70 family n=1 Tax=[Clostridium] polysaccharolyticum TaxID=29364 RepID=A0A1I0A9B3_9FIRM|nr:helix-turn-helix domain-containing protein [[Clostridium] polysaccharolyticum]SES90744.1 RNA polymerase sigma factor, sigma-70 family [[Clostridium] polysaccharolyticum]